MLEEETWDTQPPSLLAAGDPEAQLTYQHWRAEGELTSSASGPRADELDGRSRGGGTGRLGRNYLEAGVEVLADGELDRTSRDSVSEGELVRTSGDSGDKGKLDGTSRNSGDMGDTGATGVQLQLTLSDGSVGWAYLQALDLHQHSHCDARFCRLPYLVRQVFRLEFPGDCWLCRSWLRWHVNHGWHRLSVCDGLIQTG